MPKMRLGRRKRKKGRVFFFVLVLFLVLLLQSFWYIERKITPILQDYAKIKVIELATDVVNDAIAKKVVEMDQINRLFLTETDGNHKITSISLDVQNATRVQTETTARIRDSLDHLSHQTFYVPLGVAFNSNILATYGPTIPVTLVPIGEVEVHLNPTLQEKGINNVLLTVNLHIQTKLKVIIPFSSHETVLEQDIPIAQQLIVGEVPSYYFKGSEIVPFQLVPSGQPGPGTAPNP